MRWFAVRPMTRVEFAPSLGGEAAAQSARRLPLPQPTSGFHLHAASALFARHHGGLTGRVVLKVWTEHPRH